LQKNPHGNLPFTSQHTLAVSMPQAGLRGAIVYPAGRC
jgi:hypothetical protein